MSDAEYRGAVEALLEAMPLADRAPGIESMVRSLLRRAGRPRKWASDAERMKAKRAEKKNAN